MLRVVTGFQLKLHDRVQDRSRLSDHMILQSNGILKDFAALFVGPIISEPRVYYKCPSTMQHIGFHIGTLGPKMDGSDWIKYTFVAFHIWIPFTFGVISLSNKDESFLHHSLF